MQHWRDRPRRKLGAAEPGEAPAQDGARRLGREPATQAARANVYVSSISGPASRQLKAGLADQASGGRSTMASGPKPCFAQCASEAATSARTPSARQRAPLGADEAHHSGSPKTPSSGSRSAAANRRRSSRSVRSGGAAAVCSARQARAVSCVFRPRSTPVLGRRRAGAGRACAGRDGGAFSPWRCRRRVRARPP